MNHKHLLAAGLLGLSLTAPALAANMVLNNVDAPGIGFNDPTPATPVGGNIGTTVGAQRLIAYKRALELWGKTLKSDVTIVVRGSFARLNCTAASGTLAQAGALQIFDNFPGAPLANHWYGVALANAISGQDLAPGPLDPIGFTGEPADDIIASFNGDIGQADCIAGPGWYYGLDNNADGGKTDFLDTFMHEVAHGLGFQNFVSETSGVLIGGQPDVYMANTLDLDKGRWNTFTTPAQIIAASINTGRVVWDGAKVTANAPLVLGPLEGVRLGGGLIKEIEFGTALYGPAPTAANFKGSLVVASDGTVPVGDACEAITTPVAGKIAMADRGFCNFSVKSKNAQIAGAVGVVIANTLGRGSFAPGGADATVTIPTIGISNADGDAIKAAGGVTIEYFSDPTRLAGTIAGYVRLYAPTPVEQGSSISHFDTSASPSVLMEPFITPALQSALSLDLTPSLMQDIGWQIETLKVGACDSGVPSVLATGQMLHVNVEVCSKSAAGSRGKFASCMAKVTEAATAKGLLTGSQKNAVMSCAARGTY